MPCRCRCRCQALGLPGLPGSPGTPPTVVLDRIVSPDGSTTARTFNSGNFSVVNTTTGVSFSSSPFGTLTRYGATTQMQMSTNDVDFQVGGTSFAVRLTPTQSLLGFVSNPIPQLGSVLEVRASADVVAFAAASLLYLARSNGTILARTPVLVDEIVGSLGGSGFDGTTYGTIASVDFVVGQNLTNAAHGGRIEFKTVPLNSLVNSSRMTLTDTGLSVYGTNGGFSATTVLDVLGTSGNTLRIRDGNQATGKVLTSIDNNGVAQWQFLSSLVSPDASTTVSALNSGGFSVVNTTTGVSFSSSTLTTLTRFGANTQMAMNASNVDFQVGGNTFAVRLSASQMLVGFVGAPTSELGSRLEVRASADIVAQGGTAALLYVARTNGTFLAKTPVLSGETVGVLNGAGYDGAAYGIISSVAFVAQENLAPGFHGGRIEFNTVAPGGSVANTDRMTLTATGLSVYGSNGGFQATTVLDVLGTSGNTLRVRDGNQAAGKVLTSIDANGVAQWQLPSIGALFWTAAAGASQAYAVASATPVALVPPVAATLGAVQNFDQPSFGQLRYTGLVTKNFVVTMTASIGGSGALDDVYLLVYVNGAPLSAMTTRATSAATGFQSLAVTVSVQLATNDFLEVWAKNQTSANFNLAALSISASS